MVDELRCICPWMEGFDPDCPHHGRCAAWGHEVEPGYHTCHCGVRQLAPILVRKGPDGLWWVWRRGATYGRPWRFWQNAIWCTRRGPVNPWTRPLPESLAAL